MSIFSPNFLKLYFTHGTSVERIEQDSVHRAVLQGAQAYRAKQSRLVFMLIIPMCLIFLTTLGDNLEDSTGMYWWVFLVFGGTTVRWWYCETMKHRVPTASAQQLIRHEHGLLLTALVPAIFVGSGNWLIGSQGDEYAVICVALSSCIYSVGNASSVAVYPFALHLLLLANLGQTIAFHLGFGKGGVHLEIGFLFIAQTLVLVSMSTTLYEFFKQSKKSEGESRRAAEMKDRFIRSASHDLSQPAFALNMFAGALANMDSTEEQARVAHLMARAVKILSEEVKKLEVGAGVIDTEGQLGITDLRSLCQTIATTEGVKTDVKIVVQGHTDVIFVKHEYWVIARCLTNAVNNAVKHSSADLVIISIDCNEDDPYDDEVVVSVKDSGKGMDEKLVDKFWNKVEGENTGQFGIASIRTLATQHGIQTTLQSTPNASTTFKMMLTRIESPSPIKPIQSIIRDTKVLIVDDQIIVAEALALLLSKYDCEAVIFTDPHKAIAYQDISTIDFAFIDDNLGGDFDGLSLGKQLDIPDHRIAIMTGSAMKARRDHIATHFSVVRKPFESEMLEHIFV